MLKNEELIALKAEIKAAREAYEAALANMDAATEAAIKAEEEMGEAVTATLIAQRALRQLLKRWQTGIRNLEGEGQ